MKQLNFMQKQFVTEYIKTLDGEKSVKNAGFTVEDAKEFAQELLSRDYIIREIKYQLNRQIDALNVPKGYVIQKLLQIAQFSLEEEDILDKDGNFTGKRKLRQNPGYTGSGTAGHPASCQRRGLWKIRRLSQDLY